MSKCHIVNTHRSELVTTDSYWYLLHVTHKVIKAHGLLGRALWEVTQATLVAQITYASPSWRGFIKAEEVARLKAILLKACLYGYLPADFLSLEDLQIPVMTHSLQLPDITLNTSYINSFHHQNALATISVLVDTASTVIPSEYMRKNFVNRMLYSDIY